MHDGTTQWAATRWVAAASLICACGAAPATLQPAAEPAAHAAVADEQVLPPPGSLPPPESLRMMAGELSSHGSFLARLSAHVAHYSELLQTSSAWADMPTYWQAFLMVLVVVVVFLCLWGCAYVFCLALSDKATLFQLRRKRRRAA